ncbi:P-loop containing nucleoside triphosphate hydrolase protein [Suillus subaureus]|uniref:P-loop containing nucleoside triphosphate hydrolase protein n=1 Tax=Suillus subaureus TaxID=48587 RepID=A0A9P7JCK1_9AGAM|nr:P-loop containing nucleoside triphosphate hydrolase protein [Suillus subaureus]KAG1815214.1 P-loop containing nucleoside triphosphate hydrolase protein [Suillus subaureus]
MLQTVSVTPGPAHNGTDTCNVIVFGEAGAGKSSLINLITREYTARVSSDTMGCTTETNAYETEISIPLKLKVKLFDTAGLDEGPGGTVPNMQARKVLKTLIRTLMMQGGIHLIVYCVRGERVIRTLRRNYDLIRSQVKMRVPIALVVTGLEYHEPDMEAWWRKNERIISNHGMTFAGHACVTTAMSHKNASPKLPERRDESYLTVCKLIEQCRLSNERGIRGVNRRGTNKTTSSTHKNIVLFGQMGAGKSSLVNLMAGKDVADTSNNIQLCTLHWKQYPVEFDGRSYMVFDTVGLVAPQLKKAEYLDAVEDACKLIQHLETQGSIDLLLFCIRPSEVADTLQKNYMLFHEFLCDKKVPIVVVITHLEQEGAMDDWWKKNSGTLRDWNIRVDDHACITAIKGNRPNLYEESRAKIHNLVQEFTDDRHKLKGPLVGNGSLQETNDIVHFFTRRCGMSSDDANELADRIKKTR